MVILTKFTRKIEAHTRAAKKYDFFQKLILMKMGHLELWNKKFKISDIWPKKNVYCVGMYCCYN